MSRSKLRWPFIAKLNPKSPITEAYKMLRTNIDFSNIESNVQTVMFTSTRMTEGKSVTTANIAVTYAQAGKKVLLIDADMRRSTQHQIFGVPNRSGLSSVLSNQCKLQEAILSTSVDHLSIIPAGPVPPNPSDMLASKRMESLMEQTKEMFDMILIDTPPILLVTDAQVVAANCDGTVLVIEPGSVKRDLALKAKASLTRVNARILGVVLNNVKRNGIEEHFYA
ncbi:CpsD/CapB family tyrosine-protein kinase [Paenibacillus tarimensis]